MTALHIIKTKSGNNIELIEKRPEIYGKTVLIIGVFHGDEIEGEFLINKYLEYSSFDPDGQAKIKVTEKNFPEQLKNRLLFIPCLNPDGKALNTRQNANKIDLNRNFATKNWEKTNDKDYFGGNEPNSEIETQFLIYILEQYKIDCILTLHTPYQIVNFDGPAEKIAEKISELTTYPMQKDIGYPTPGSFGTYAGVERNIPVITLELPDNKTPESLWNQNKSVFDYFALEF